VSIDPKTLKRIFERATGPFVAAGTLVTALVGGVDYLKGILIKNDIVDETWATKIAISVFLMAGTASVLLSIHALSRRSMLLLRDRFDLRVRKPDDLIGRNEDVDQLRLLILQNDEVLLDGESGSGKSALARYGLFPVLHERGELLPVLLSEYIGDWDSGLAQQTFNAIWKALTESERKSLDMELRPAIGTIDAATVERILTGVADKLGRMPVLIFDQFDDYQLANRSAFLDRERAWIGATELMRINRFWRVIGAACGQQRTKLLFMTRADASSWLNSMRFTNSIAVRTLGPPQEDWLKTLMAQIAKDDEKGEVVSNPAAGWSDLKAQLEFDLEITGAVLPQQVRIAFLGLRELPALTPSDYTKAEGLAGVEALYIHKAIQAAAQVSGAKEEAVRRLLLELVERGHETAPKTRSRTSIQLSKWIPDADTRTKVLERLARAEIIRESKGGDGAEIHWQLDHDYLCHAVAAEEGAANRLSVLLREREATWKRAGSDWKLRLRGLLPLRTQAAMAWARLRKRNSFSYGTCGPYAAWSLLRALPLFLLVAGAGAWTLWSRTGSYQIRQMVALASEVKMGLSSNGAEHWAYALAVSGRFHDALEQARNADSTELRVDLLAKVAEGLAIRGDLNDAVAAAVEAVGDAKQASLENRVAPWDKTILEAIEAIGEAGGKDQALIILASLQPEILPDNWPATKREAEVALSIARIYCELNHSGEAHADLLNWLPKLKAANANLSAVATAFHLAGDDVMAKTLTDAFATNLVEVVRLTHGMFRDNPIAFASLADLYLALGHNDVAATAALEKAISAMKNLRHGGISYDMRGPLPFGADEPFYIERILVRGSKAAAVPEAARYQGDPLFEVIFLTDAAVEADRVHLVRYSERFMAVAENRAHMATQPLPRSQLLAALAVGYLELGNMERAQAVFLEALADARRIPETIELTTGFDFCVAKMHVLAILALGLQELPPNDVSWQVALEAEALSRRASTPPSVYLPELARALAQSGEFRLSRIAAERALDPNSRLDAFAATLNGITFYNDRTLEKRVNRNTGSQLSAAIGMSGSQVIITDGAPDTFEAGVY
jgi:hypothetical protein